jgi:hypothetical protein
MSLPTGRGNQCARNWGFTKKRDCTGRYKWETGLKRMEKLTFVIGMLLLSWLN